MAQTSIRVSARAAARRLAATRGPRPAPTTMTVSGADLAQIILNYPKTA